MSTPRTMTAEIANGMGGDARFVLFHNNSDYGTQQGSFDIASGATGPGMTVNYKTGIGSWGVQDWWSVLALVKDGPNAGLWVSSGTVADKYWKECQLQHADDNTTIALQVSAGEFKIPLKSGGCSGGMTRLTPAVSKPISHVFVVMLENHSFDNMLAFSGIPGITAATTANSNSYNGTQYNVVQTAPLTLTTDPGHEFDDVFTQLHGYGQTFTPGPYPASNNSGFAASYATSTSEVPHQPPAASHIDDIMACFDTPNQLGTTQFLASTYSVCDHWFSSLPGPTWPNRFFLHGASSSGFDDSPTSAQMVKWEVPGFGFTYPNGSVYDMLSKAGIPYRFYNDTDTNLLSLYSDDPQNGSKGGAVPQVTSLKGVTLLDINSLRHFAEDLQGPYPYPYTFIEPHYGDIVSGTYAGGSSQHPMDDVYGGEGLLNAVYQAISQSPYWETSILIVTYDEHGGYYDSVAPQQATPPGDNPPSGNNTHGFEFDSLGVRVPAIVISPLVANGVDSTVYDHSSVAKFMESLWSLPNLTARDAAANSPLDQVGTLTTTGEAPPHAPKPKPRVLANRPVLSAEDKAAVMAEPLDQSKAAALHFLLRKAHRECLGATEEEVTTMVAPIRTRGDLEAYAEYVLTRVEAQRVAKRAVERSPD